MGQLHNALDRGRLSAALKNALGASKSEGGIERYGETLTPGIDLWMRPEWALLRDEELFGVAETQAAGAAGTFPKIGVFNPATSNLLVVVFLHYISPAIAGTRVELYPITVALGNGATVKMRDRRRTVSHGAMSTFEASAAAGADLIFSRDWAADRTPLELPIVLPPGQGFMWRGTDDAASMQASFAGYQRVAFRGEL